MSLQFARLVPEFRDTRQLVVNKQVAVMILKIRAISCPESPTGCPVKVSHFRAVTGHRDNLLTAESRSGKPKQGPPGASRISMVPFHREQKATGPVHDEVRTSTDLAHCHQGSKPDDGPYHMTSC